MTRSGRRRAWPVEVFAAVFMAALLLGATLLVSAGSDHHAREQHTHEQHTHEQHAHEQHTHDSAPAAAITVDGPTASAAPAGHEHRHGNDWTPSPGQRLRPATDDTAVRTIPIGATGSGRPPVGVAGSSPPAPPDDGLTLLGVLRI